jgi:hypothetical protein
MLAGNRSSASHCSRDETRRTVYSGPSEFCPRAAFRPSAFCSRLATRTDRGLSALHSITVQLAGSRINAPSLSSSSRPRSGRASPPCFTTADADGSALQLTPPVLLGPSTVTRRRSAAFSRFHLPITHSPSFLLPPPPFPAPRRHDDAHPALRRLLRLALRPRRGQARPPVCRRRRAAHRPLRPIPQIPRCCPRRVLHAQDRRHDLRRLCRGAHRPCPPVRAAPAAEPLAQAIEGQLRTQPGILSVKVALLAERGVVEFDPAVWTPEKLAGVRARSAAPRTPLTPPVCRRSRTSGLMRSCSRPCARTKSRSAFTA